MKADKRARTILAAGFAAALLFSILAMAGDTKRWDINAFKDWSKGKPLGVEIGSAGTLRPAQGIESTEVSADAVWSAAMGKGGEVYLGTGNSGKLFRARGGNAEEVFASSHVAITQVRVDNSGEVYFSAIPGGVIYKLRGDGEAVKFCDTGEKYIWDFILDGNRVIAATGPSGKILVIDQAGKVDKTIETGDKHVMCLLKEGGKIYAGTSGDGLVLEVDPGGKITVLQDFDEKEVRRLAWADGKLIVAVNDEAGSRPPEMPSSPLLVPSQKKDDKAEGDEGGDEDSGGDDQGPIPMMMMQAPQGQGRVSGSVYAMAENGGRRRLFDLPKTAAIDLAVAGPDVYVAADQGGKVYRFSADSSEYAISFDLDNAQALCLIANGKGLEYIGAGAPAALAKVKSGTDSDASYQTDVLDAGFPARWGEIEAQADGPVQVLTRSGMVKNPERGWSDWRPIGIGNSGKAKSPEARYLQVMIKWPLGSRAVVRSLSIPYSVFNQPHYVENVAVDQSEQDGQDGGSAMPSSMKSSKSDNGSAGPGQHQSDRKIKWKTTNPDGDNLEYHLFFQPDGTDKWIAINTSDPITKTSYSWDTSSIPDGWYKIKVVATDAPSNPPEQALTAEAVSDKFLVDNNAPSVKGLTIMGGTVRGKAEDSASAISGIQYSIDGADWVVVAAEDGVLDQKSESFKFDLPSDLEPGLHIISVRAWDRGLNMGSAQEKFEKK